MHGALFLSGRHHPRGFARHAAAPMPANGHDDSDRTHEMTTHTSNQFTNRPSFRIALLAAAAGLALVSGTPAQAMVGDEYDPEHSPVTTTWYGAANPAALQADRDYIAGMRPHHAGALTMSEAFLADPQANNPVLRRLAQAIIHNQRYEIGVLDEVGRNLDMPPAVIDLGLFKVSLQPQATEGLAQRQRFIKTPVPGLLAFGTGPVNERDVQFAKAMTIHHQGALDMARAYNADPDARNGFLKLLNVDIITDQFQEITLMDAVIAAYPGDADAVQVDDSMIHGMEGMSHGDAHSGHGAAPPDQGHGGQMHHQH